MLPITTFYAGLLGLLMLTLALLVVRQRGAQKISLGEGDPNGPLQRAVRAHANAAEYVPIVLILIAVNEASGTPGWVLHILGIAFLIARVSHALALGAGIQLDLRRQIGAGLTFTTLLVAAVLAVVNGL